MIDETHETWPDFYLSRVSLSVLGTRLDGVEMPVQASRELEMPDGKSMSLTFASHSTLIVMRKPLIYASPNNALTCSMWVQRVSIAKRDGIFRSYDRQVCRRSITVHADAYCIW